MFKTHKTQISSRSKASAVASSKFNLYLKSREIGQIAKFLNKIEFMNKAEREAWANDNEALIEEMLDEFMDDSVLILERQNLDGESLQLSMDLVKNLRETSELLQNLLYDNQL